MLDHLSAELLLSIAGGFLVLVLGFYLMFRQINRTFESDVEEIVERNTATPEQIRMMVSEITAQVIVSHNGDPVAHLPIRMHLDHVERDTAKALANIECSLKELRLEVQDLTRAVLDRDRDRSARTL